MSNPADLGEFSREQFLQGFEDAYTQAPYCMVKLGCRGPALEAFQSDLDTDGWSVIDKMPTDTSSDPLSSPGLTLRPPQDTGSMTGLSHEETVELAHLFNGSLNPECNLPDGLVANLAVRHKVLMAVGYFFPISLLDGNPSEQDQRHAMNSFYQTAKEKLPEDDPRVLLSGSRLGNELVGRFSHGFALLGLLDSLHRYGGGKLSDDLARGGLARIIDNGRVHANPRLRTIGNPLRPDTIQDIITQHSAMYNRTHG